MSLTPGSHEWHAKVQRLRAEESAHPEAWWWLSFGDETGWLGSCFVKARGFTLALEEARRRGINPGGQCRGEGPLPEIEDESLANRLLQKGDLEWERM